MRSFDRYYQFILSDEARERAERFVIWLSIVSFLLHLLIIALISLGFIEVPFESQLLRNPISAIYTPFSFILLFEVYLLVYHIPMSTSDYIAKQYEIITLIVIRRIFKDLANLDLSINWFEDKYDLQFTYDIISTLVLFLLIYFFHKLIEKKSPPKSAADLPEKVQTFIRRKKIMAFLLVPVILGMAVYSFGQWGIASMELLLGQSREDANFINLNKIFFDEFFTLLILTDVLLLLFSFFHTTKFHVFIRNSGFIISTILIRISFSVDGLLNSILIVVAVSFGLLILLVTRQYSALNSSRLQI